MMRWSWIFAVASCVPQEPAVPMTDAWLDQQLVAWAPPNAHPTSFGVVLHTLSYANVLQSYDTDAVVDAELDMLAASGADLIRIDINYDPWLRHDASGIAKYDHAVAAVRARGLALMLADAAAESYRNDRITWDAYRSAWIDRVHVLAARYTPDYYVVVKEPGWYWLMPSDIAFSQPWTRLDDWIALATTLVQTVKAASPATKLAIATPGDTLYHEKTGPLLLDWFRAARSIDGLDILGVDNYNVLSFTDAQQFADEGLGGKTLWLLEAWSSSGAKAGSPAQAPIDVKFVRAAAYFTERFEGGQTVYFFSAPLAAYAALPTDEAGLIDFYRGRTPTFDELVKLAQGQ